MGSGKEVPFCRNSKVFFMEGQVDKIESILVLSCTAISEVNDPLQVWDICYEAKKLTSSEKWKTLQLCLWCHLRKSRNFHASSWSLRLWSRKQMDAKCTESCPNGNLGRHPGPKRSSFQKSHPLRLLRSDSACLSFPWLLATKWFLSNWMIAEENDSMNSATGSTTPEKGNFFGGKIESSSNLHSNI